MNLWRFPTRFLHATLFVCGCLWLAGLASVRAADYQEPDARGEITVVGFEQFEAGTFDQLETAIGVWTPALGKAIIDDAHAHSGTKCLQLAGGEQTSITLEIAEDVDNSGELSFWAERWTKRLPFSFRIEKNSGSGWQEIFAGDQSVKVGRAFLSHVRVPLGDEAIEQLRFTVISPINTGILIDDIRLAPLHAQEIVRAEVVPFTLPALIGRPASPLLKLKIETAGSLHPIALTEIQAALDAREGDVRSSQVFYGGAGHQFRAAAVFGVDQPADQELTFSGRQVLQEGENYFWLCGTLDDQADLDHRVGAGCRQLAFSNGQTLAVNSEIEYQRMGIALRSAGDDDVHTYRIPGLATTNNGTLIGVYDVRRRSGGDLPGDIDVGMSRSLDGGRTWESMQIIMDMGKDPEWRYDGIGDPAVLVDRNTGTIWVAATWSHGNRSWHGSGPGLTPEETGQLMLVRSDDDGVTWSEPINITAQVKKPEWSFILQGPGKGITMRDGTLVFAAQYQDPPEANRLPHSTIIYSKDHGKTWQAGSGAFDDTTESQVVELEPGVLMLNCRYNREAVRVVMITRDLGESWETHRTSQRSLIEPGACMASLIDVGQELGDDDGSWLLFSNPDSTSGRHHLTIKASPDRGLSWPKQHRLLLDEEKSAGYSCMTMIDSQTVGILYEGSQAHMTFQRIPLNDLIHQGGPLNEGQAPSKPPKVEGEPRAKRDRRPNILLIVGEDHGCELSCYGDPVIRTPNIDQLASQGVLFESAYVTQSVCSPSRSTIFTGLYPHQNGQLGLATHDYGWFRKWPSTYSLLKQSGYRTGLIGKTHINPPEAVESFVDFRFQRGSNFSKRNVANYAVEAGKFFQADDRPFFLTVNYPDAHWPLQGQVDGLPVSQVDPKQVQVMPYVGDENPRLREVVRNYYDCMLRLDACVGQLLTHLEDAGKAENTLVVFLGDHGAQMARGKVTVYEGGMRVPTIIRWPGVATPGSRSKALVSTIDLLPTFTDAAEAPTPPNLPGKSLKSVLTGEEQDSLFRQYLVCERNCDAAHLTFPQRTIRDSRYKLIYSPVRDREDPAARYYRIHGASHWAGCLTDDELVNASKKTKRGYARWLNPPEFQLFDLQRDPHEWNDLSEDPEYVAILRRLQAALEQWQTETADPLADRERLQMLMQENDAVAQSGRRSPEGGWQYLQYLVSDEEPPSDRGKNLPPLSSPAR